MTQSGGYVEQYLRVERWFTRLQDAAVSKPYVRPLTLTQQIEFLQDELYAFFVNCYHLKDWIEKDETIPFGQSEVESFIARNSYLKLCADLCNSSKHLQLRSQGRSNLHPRTGSPSVRHSFLIDSSKPELDRKKQSGVRFAVETDGGEKIDSLILAAHCLDAWTDFLLPFFASRLHKIVKQFHNQTIPGSIFSREEAILLPDFSKGEISLKINNIGTVIQVNSRNESWTVIARLKGRYAYAEDRQKARGGLLWGKFKEQSITELISVINTISLKTSIWLVLAMESEEFVNTLGKHLNVKVSNMKQLAELEELLLMK